MPKVSNYTRTRIELLYKQGLHPAEMFKFLKGEGLLVSFASVNTNYQLLTSSVANLPHSGRPRKLPVEASAFLHWQMRNDEMMSAQIQKKLAKRGGAVSSSTVRKKKYPK